MFNVVSKWHIPFPATPSTIILALSMAMQTPNLQRSATPLKIVNVLLREQRRKLSPNGKQPIAYNSEPHSQARHLRVHTCVALVSRANVTLIIRTLLHELPTSLEKGLVVGIHNLRLSITLPNNGSTQLKRAKTTQHLLFKGLTPQHC